MTTVVVFSTLHPLHPLPTLHPLPPLPILPTRALSVRALFALSTILVAVVASLAVAAPAEAQSAPGPPLITRVIEADFAKEEFTIRWRPPLSDGGSPITGYYIYRSQNRYLDDRDGKLNGNVNRCDELYTVETNGVPAQWRITSGSGRLITDPELFYTVTQTVSTTGASYNNCYRWHIIAVNAVNTPVGDVIPSGSQVITDPIFSRGYRLGGRGYAYDETVDNGGTACPAGRFRGYGGEAIREGIWGNINSSPTVYCMRPGHLYAYDTCLNQPGFHVLLSTGDGTLDFCGITSTDGGVCTRQGFTRNLGYDGQQYQRCQGRRCGAEDSLAAYHPDHRECHCVGWAEPASGTNAAHPTDCDCNVLGAIPTTCECPAGTEYLPEDHRCGICASGEDVLNGECVAGRLAAEVVKLNPNLATIRALLGEGRSPDAIAAGSVPVLLTAAALGHADVVSILITAGADPKVTNPKFYDGNLAHMMAAWDGAALTVNRLDKRTVLRYFGDALEISGADFDWNALDGNNNHVVNLLTNAKAVEGGGDLAALREMSDYMLTKGMNCFHLSGAARYAEYCIGTLGQALADAVTAGSPALEDVRAKAQAMKDAGVPLDVAGDVSHGGLDGGLVAEAAWAREPEIMAALITFGADAAMRGRQGRAALHHIGNYSHAHTGSALTLLHSFIGALEDAGKFDSFDGWNDDGLIGRVLDDFRLNADLNGDNAGVKARIHELLYESGARCMIPHTFVYCAIPREEIEAEASAPGVVATVWRPRLRFRGFPAGLVSSLSGSGWKLTVDTGPEPDVLRFSRTRIHEEGDIDAVFAVTLYNHRLQDDADGRVVRVSARAVPAPQFPLMLSAALAGDADAMLPYLRPEFVDATTENGTPLLLTAAALGHARVVSVLITAGFDPDARLLSFHRVNAAHLMATYDGTEQPGGGELSRANRLNVLRHFGDAIRVRATLFDWNARTGNNFHLEHLLSLSNDRATAEDKVLIQDMADYMLGQGMHCRTHRTTEKDRHHLRCTGTLGKALADLIDRVSAQSPSAEEVRAAAAAMAAAGIPATLAGFWSNEPGLLPHAAFNRHWEAVSVLITLGFDLGARSNGNRTALHNIAYHSDYHARDVWEMARHFVGALYESGRLEEFNNLNGWNVDDTNFSRRPLDEFRTWVYTRPSAFLDEKLETQSLLYEHGARCNPAADDADTERYCLVPQADLPVRNAVAKWEGGALTVTARRGSGFREPPVDSAVLQSISGDGWAVTLERGPEPDELVLGRSRRPLGNPPVLDSPAVFTLTLTSAAGADSRVVRVSAGLAMDESQLPLITAVRSGDAGEVRRILLALGSGFEDTTTEDGIPILIEAAALGHAEIVSVLVTAGANPAVGHPDWANRNVALLMATYDGTPQPEGGELPRGARATVLYHFGDALDVRATMFDWNGVDDDDYHASDLLRFSYDTEPFETAPILLEMADYMLERGMNCNHEEARHLRYNRHCVGSLGAVLAGLIRQSTSSPPSVEEILAAAGAMEARGISATLAGSAAEGALVAIAARRLHAEALSVLITLGFDPEGENSSGRTAVQQMARDSDIHAPRVAEMLRRFVGGLSVAGKLSGFAGWNTEAENEGRPLEAVNTYAQQNNLDLEEKDEVHALLYERGARCAAPEGERYCGVPETAHYPLIGRSLTGGVYTITARAASGFRVPLAEAGVLTMLATLGWGVTLNAEAEPEEAILTRTRTAETAGYGVTFTLAMTVAAEDTHYARVEAALPNDDYLFLVSAVRSGDSGEAGVRLAALGTAYVDAEDASGLPLQLVAAGLGHGGVVSVLITFGFDPDARHSGYDDGGILHMMARYDGPGITRAEKLDVVRHFGDAVAVRGTLHDWNALDGNGERMMDLLLAAARREGLADADPVLTAETADYALARGGRCGSMARTDRGHIACTGNLGAALASIVVREPLASDAEVRGAAQAMVDAGISVSVAYSLDGAPVALAGGRRNASAVSILITFGADPDGRASNTRGVLHYIGRNADVNPAELVTLLHYFIGGLSVAGKLDTFDGWNLTSNVKTPLLALHNFAAVRADDFAPEREIHSLMYEHGARCDGDPPGTRTYCDVPYERVEPSSALAVGDGFTVTARGFAGEYFAALPTAPGEVGWTVALNAGASPDEVVVSRATLTAPTDLPIGFTVVLLAPAAAYLPGAAPGEAVEIRHYRVTPRPLVEYASEPSGAGGTLTADVASGTRVKSGSTVTFVATPTVNFYVSGWRGINCPSGGAEAKGAAGLVECPRTIEADISVAVVFGRDCSTENRLAGAASHLCGGCLDATLQDFEGVCLVKPHAYYSAEPPIGGAGTLSADFESGGQVSVGVVLTFTATPGEGYYVAEWSSDGATCSGGDVSKTGAAGRVVCPITVAATVTGTLNVVARFKSANPDCEGENRHEFGGRCGGCLEGEGYVELRGLCLKEDGDYENIPQADVCRLLRGDFAKDETVCVNVDADGTFCILDSAGEESVFPCQGLFRRVLHCNLAYHRPGKNPFVCGGRCENDEVAQGGECRDDKY